MNILYYSKDKDSREFLTHLSQAKGYQLTAVASVYELHQHLQNHVVDVQLISLANLKREHNAEILQALKKTTEIPTVFLTTPESYNLLNKEEKALGNKQLSIPLKPATIFSELEQLCHQQ